MLTSTIFTLALWTISVPLIGSTIIPLLCKLRRKVIEYFSIIIATLSLVSSISLVALIIKSGINLPLSIIMGSEVWSFSIFIDQVTLVMLLIVPVISFLVVFYSLGYMRDDEDYVRYYSFLLLFIGGMLGLILVGNLLYLYLFWEVVGLTSCLLIAHWYHKPEASKAGIKAFVVTRIGDTFLLVSIALFYLKFGSLNFADLRSRIALAYQVSPIITSRLLTILLSIAFVGAIGKSAQFPLHVWLPDAMEGPTTVSALIHAATMVKAGVYLVARFETLLLYSHVAPNSTLTFFKFVAFIGGFTSLIAASMAIVAIDIKRVLAYSTISQLGLMFLGLGLGGAVGLEEALKAGTFHMLSHAYFKALLFLSAGVVIHALGTRDMRLMGGLSKRLPITCIAMSVGALSLMGLPPFSGFFSKEELLHVASTAFTMRWGSVFLTSASILTAFYSLRLIYLTFFAPPSEYVRKHHIEHEELVMIAPLIILSVLCLVAPLLMQFVWEGFRITVEVHNTVKGLIILLIGAGSAYLVYFREMIPRERLLRTRPIMIVNDILFNGYYIDALYERVLLRMLASLPSYIAYIIDEAITLFIDVVSVRLLASLPTYIANIIDESIEFLNNALVSLFVYLSESIRNIHVGNLKYYITLASIGLLIVLLVLLARVIA